MKKVITFLLLVIVVNSCVSQQIKKSELSYVVNNNINHIELSKLIFFAKELIDLGVDTTFQSKFRKKIIQYNKIKRRTVGDQKEYDLTLYLLRRNLAAEKVTEAKYQKSKDFFNSLLFENEEIRLSINENLILQQIDDSKRGLINGYDEGAVDASMFVFFCYDPLMYKMALLKKGNKDDWNRMGVFLCNYLRENGNPLAIRNPIKEKIISMLNKKEIQNEFIEVVKELKTCNVSENLFD